MIFESFASAWTMFLIAGFILAVILGAVVHKTGFCTMGAISDWVNIGDTGRWRAWLMAIGVAMIGLAIFEYIDMARPDNAFPGYRNGNLIWMENLLGGLMFGIGMTFASGCANKNLVRLGAGNMKSLMVLAIIGVVAYFMVNPFPGTDKTLFSTLFYPWIRPMAIDLGVSQDLGALVGGSENTAISRLIMGLVIGFGLLIYAFKSAGFRKNSDHWAAGLIIGLVILGAWVATSVIQVEADGETMALSSYYTDWDLYADDETGKPSAGAPLSPQSYTFVNPMGQTLGYATVGKASPNFLTFGIVAVFGVIFGSFLWGLFNKGLRFEWFTTFTDFKNHVMGSTLMGFGGVLGLGCTIGQGITGVSTLAIGSFITLFGIVIGCAATMKVQYYKMVYEEEATFGKALVASLADLRLLPNSLRSLDKV